MASTDERKRQEWVEEKNAKVFTLVHATSALQLDVFLEYPVPYDSLRASANEGVVGSSRFRYSSKEHLIEAKQAVQPPRKIDRRDIEDLKELIERERKAGK